jgi:predicted phosphoribosyltransferase
MPAILHRFADRREAGEFLAAALLSYADQPGAIVLALPRGGVPVAHEVAKALRLPMDLWLVRKLGAPGHPELAMGALAARDTDILNEDVIRHLRIRQQDVDAALETAKMELERRNSVYRHGRPPPDVTGRTAIVVDDGLATGATMRAAVVSLRRAGAEKIVAAAPVGEVSVCAGLRREADEVVCPFTPAPFHGVGEWYEDFTQMTDGEVWAFLSSGESRASA